MPGFNVKYGPGTEVLIKAKVEHLRISRNGEVIYYCKLPGFSTNYEFSEDEILMELVDTSEEDIDKCK